MADESLPADELAARVVRYGDDPAILQLLEEVCWMTGMGFAAVACVTEERWIACQVLDRIEFGLTPGGELDVSTTICDDIRKTQRGIVIDHVSADADWCTHPVPILYGFQSYVSLPLILDDGSFFGTLCAIDPSPRLLRTPEMIEALENCARQVAQLLSDKLGFAISPAPLLTR
jgi:GAF domain-containing protein